MLSISSYLHLAVASKHYEVIPTLLELGIDTHAVDVAGKPSFQIVLFFTFALLDISLFN